MTGRGSTESSGSRIGREIERAIAAARGRVLRDWLGKADGELTLGALFDEFSGTPWDEAFREVHLGEFGRAPDARRAAPRPDAESDPHALEDETPRRRVRTRSERLVLDTLISDRLRAEPAGFEVGRLAELVGATEAQVSASLQRLRDLGKTLGFPADGGEVWRWISGRPGPAVVVGTPFEPSTALAATAEAERSET